MTRPQIQTYPKCDECHHKVPMVITTYQRGVGRVDLCPTHYADYIQKQSVVQLEMEFPEEQE